MTFTMRVPLLGRTVQRVELPGGASLEVPPETIVSPAARVALAQALEAAAATLRGEPDDEQKADRKTNRKSNRKQRANRKGETP